MKKIVAVVLLVLFAVAAPADFTDEQGKLRPMYQLSRDGFTLVAMGFTGKKALDWKVRYIEAFNAMERALLEGKHGDPVALTPSSTADRVPLRSLVNAWSQVCGQPYQVLWPQVKAHFQLSRINDLPVEWIPDALAFVQSKIDALPKALPEASEPDADKYYQGVREDLDLVTKIVGRLAIDAQFYLPRGGRLSQMELLKYIMHHAKQTHGFLLNAKESLREANRYALMLDQSDRQVRDGLQAIPLIK